MSSTLRRAEWGVALLLTLAVIWLHFIAVTSAGALWRDEANTVSLATLPTLGDVWRNLQYDSFPILWLLIVRAFCAVVGPMNDPALRALGFCIGIGVVGAIWFYARTFRQSVPLLSLSLLALSPSLIQWGDTVRGYGFGILLILVTGALLWRFVEAPSKGRFAAAALAAIVSVHVLFYNAVLLFAFCSGAVAVCVMNRAWNRAALVGLIGALAAISMVPYLNTIRAASRWNMLVQIPDYTLTLYWMKLGETLQPAGLVAVIVWIEMFALAVIGGARTALSPSWLNRTTVQRQVALFSTVSLAMGVPAVFLFLHHLSYVTRPWYYLALLAVAGVCMDALFGALIHTPAARITRLTVVLLLAGATFPSAMQALRVRLTNVDLVASHLRRIAKPTDFVVVADWHNGVSFQRYYRGPATWVTIPPIAFHSFHRYDLFKEEMMAADQTEPVAVVVDEASKALRRGNRVFAVVGPWYTSQRPTVLPPAPLPRDPWPVGDYNQQWASMVGFFLHQHALKISMVSVRSRGPVSRYETVFLFAAEGWRP